MGKVRTKKRLKGVAVTAFTLVAVGFGLFHDAKPTMTNTAGPVHMHQDEALPAAPTVDKNAPVQVTILPEGAHQISEKAELKTMTDNRHSVGDVCDVVNNAPEVTGDANLIGFCEDYAEDKAEFYEKRRDSARRYTETNEAIKARAIGVKTISAGGDLIQHVPAYTREDDKLRHENMQQSLKEERWLSRIFREQVKHDFKAHFGQEMNAQAVMMKNVQSMLPKSKPPRMGG